MRVRIKSTPQDNSLQVEDNQYKMISPTIAMFGGNYHEDGGTDINYNGTPVEVEKDETAYITNDGSMQVLGNMTVPSSGGKKFKNVAKEIANKENKAVKLQDKGINLINNSNPYNPFSALTFNSGRVMADAASQKLKQVDNQKEGLAELQNTMLSIAENTGMDPQDFSKKLSKGGTIKARIKGKYEYGGTVAKDGLSMAQRHNNPGNLKYAPWMEKYGAIKGEPGTDGGYFAKFPDTTAGQEAMVALLNKPLYKNKTVQDAIKTWTGGSSYSQIPNNIKNTKIANLSPEGFRSLLNTITTGEDSKQYNWEGLNNQADSKPSFHINPMGGSDYNYWDTQFPIENRPKQTSVAEGNQKPWMDNQYNQTIPPDNRQVSTPLGSIADKNKLGVTDFLGEIAALADRPQPVFGQQYNPQLFTPYQVSFQDRLNQNNSSFNAIARQLSNNPEALSVLAAQKYNADNSVMAEQFRTNQGITNDVINKNVGILNDAQLKNLALQDQQYTRQQQALSNTRSRKYQALANISDKFAKNQAENNSLRMAEVFSDKYRFNPETGQMDFTSPEGSNFNPIGNMYGMSGNAETLYYDAQGNPVKRVVKKPSVTEDQIEKSKAAKARSFGKWGKKVNQPLTPYTPNY